MLRVPVLLVLTALLAQSQGDSRRRDLLSLIEVSGGGQALEQALAPATLEAQMRSAMKPEEKPPEQRKKLDLFIEEFTKEFSSEMKLHRQELMDRIVLVMEKHYTTGDVQALTAFYQTPVGKKLAAVGPRIALESMQVGQAWGQELGRAIGERVAKRIDLK